MISHELKSVYNFVEKSDPALWKRCYPRIYEEPTKCGQFHSPKQVGYTLAGCAMETAGGLKGASQQNEIVWASTLAKYRVPMYWVAQDMASAIQQTVPHLWFNWKETPLPFEAMVFMVPKGCLQYDNPAQGEGGAMFVSYVRSKQKNTLSSVASGGPRLLVTENDTFSCFVTTDQGCTMHWTFSTIHSDLVTKADSLVNLANLDALVYDFDNYPHTNNFFQSDMTLEDNKFMAKCTHFIFGALLLMLTKPDTITTAIQRKKVKTKSGLTNDFWSPNIIGEHYHIRRLSLPHGSTHASPKYHWVRGAYREQPCGEKFALRKRIWIEPYQRGED